MINKVNCLIFDDHPMVCFAIKTLIERFCHVESVSTAGSMKSAMALIKQEQINLILLDVNLSDCDGFDFLRRIKSHGYQGKVIFFSAETSQLFSEIAFRLGADGYVCKSEDQSILKDAIDAVINGYTFFKFKPNSAVNQAQPELSDREAAVMNYLLKGKTNREIANILSISDKTISTYKLRLLNKFNVENIVDLAKLVSL
ncbi:response regulator transcription factor [Vibrio vulnificus]|nr:response regulator transcription factor [Vibrio vulnificus]EKO5195182.1 response regulator transcription factor [Vibrio vulnificus]EKO5197016.1 response regulator transcription factor [Vibrio vulnificus]